MPKFKAGDTITDGEIYVTIVQVTKRDYGMGHKIYMPIALTDKYWELASNEGEIVE